MPNNATVSGVISGLVLGALLGGFVYHLWGPDGASNDVEERKPLYWVAPMDPNYKSDGPGKSPMGMDLVPVYADEQGEDSPGTIRISPDIINNLGVRTDIAHAMPMNTKIQTVGYVQYDEDHLVHMHPRVEGWIEKLYIKSAGDPVVKGMPLYDIYSPVLVNAQDELILALERNSRKLVQATENRMTALKIPQTLIDKVKRTRQVQQSVTIYAPQDGVVDNLVVREGFFVQPGTNIMSIGSLDEVWVRAEVFERQAGLVKQGDKVVMTLDYLPAREWKGVVDYVYPTLDPSTRTVQVRTRFENSDYVLKPNMFAQIVIHVSDDVPSLLIPREALIRTGSSNRVVLAMGEGGFKSVEVKVGRLDEGRAEILEGLEAGDRIVVSAQFLLDSESSVTSDFKRISHGKNAEKSVWVEADVESLDISRNKLKITHKPIAAWNWDSMTMNMDIKPDIDLSGVRDGMKLHVEISQTNTGSYQITGIHIPDLTNSDHSQHDMMNHEGMDHSNHQMKEVEEMDHSQHDMMNHEGMDHSNHQMKEVKEVDHSQHEMMNREDMDHGSQGNEGDDQ